MSLRYRLARRIGDWVPLGVIVARSGFRPALLLSAAQSLAQVLCLILGHLKLPDLINNRLRIAETVNGPADSYTKLAMYFRPRPNRMAVSALLPARLAAGTTWSQLLPRWRE
jgi:hypothetical protein